MGLFRRVAFTVTMMPLGVAAAAEAGFGERSMDDDFLELCEDRGRGAYGRLKCSAFGGGRLSLGGRWRGRFEGADPYDYGRDGHRRDGTWLHRLLVHADWRHSEHLRIYAELGNHLQRGRPGGPRPTDRDAVDVTQGFVDLSHEAGAGRLTWRLGRQEVTFGANRLIAPRESANIRLSFDGAVALWRHGSWQVRGLAIKPTAVTDGSFDNRTDHGQRLWGLYAEGQPTGWGGLRLDAYGLGFHNARTTLAATAGRERRTTLGLRLSGRHGAWDVDDELIVQRGKLGRSDARGWALFTNHGYTFDAAWQPRLGLRADYTSGDRRPGDRHVGTFRPLSGPANYISEANPSVMVNLVDVYPSLRIRPRKDLTLSVGYAGLWRASRSDAFYGSGLAVLVPGNASKARHIGAYRRFAADWRVNPYLLLRLDLTRFDRGAFARAGGLASGTYAVATADLRF